MKTRHAFTLVEMLVVIAIIAIVAAMVVGMNSLAQAKKRNAAVNADKQKLLNMIDTYKAKLNFYPPDNGNLAGYTPANYSANYALYDAYAATNPLIYELTGAINNYQGSGNIMVFDGTTPSASTFSSMYNRSAVANASTDEPQHFFQPGPQTKEYVDYFSSSTLYGLIVPVELNPGALESDGKTSVANYWHYDASSPNRHNLGSYDLWAEYVTGSKNGSLIITINGNW